MTDLSQAPEVDELRDVVRAFARNRLAPAAEPAERERAIAPAVLRGLAELGILSPLERAEHGLDAVAIVVIAEELGAGDPGVAYEVLCGMHAALAVSRLGSSNQRVAERAAARGVPLGSFWCYEGFGRGPDEFSTTITRRGERLTLAGRKKAVVRPGTADFAVVVGRGDGRTAAALLVPPALGHATVVRDDHRSGKLGLNAAHTGDVELAGLEVGAENLLPTTGLAVDGLVASARLSIAAIAVGCGAAALSYAAQYATTRQAFGQPISTYQGVSFPLAEADMELRGARAAILDLALRLRKADDAATLARQTGQVVGAAMKAGSGATVTALNTLGGHGYLEDYPVQRWYRAAGTLAAIDSDPLWAS